MRLLVLLLAAAFLPAAQAVEVTADPSNPASLVPDVPTERTIDVKIACMDLLGQPERPRPWTLVHEVVPGHERLQVAGAEDHVLDESLCLQEKEVQLEVKHTLFASMDVPAEVPFDTEHRFEVRDANGEPIGSTAAIHEQAVVAWRGTLTASAERTIASAGPQKLIEFTWTLTNHGNAITRVDFVLVDGPPALGDVVLPASVILASPLDGTGDASTTVAVQYATPFQNGANSANETFTIRAVPGSAMDPAAAGEPVEQSFTATTSGVYVPGPTALLPLLVAFAGLALRRR